MPNNISNKKNSYLYYYFERPIAESKILIEISQLTFIYFLIIVASQIRQPANCKPLLSQLISFTTNLFYYDFITNLHN